MSIKADINSRWPCFGLDNWPHNLMRAGANLMGSNLYNHLIRYFVDYLKIPWDICHLFVFFLVSHMSNPSNVYSHLMASRWGCPMVLYTGMESIYNWHQLYQSTIHISQLLLGQISVRWEVKRHVFYVSSVYIEPIVSYTHWYISLIAYAGAVKVKLLPLYVKQTPERKNNWASFSLVGHPYEYLGIPITLLWATQKQTWECPLRGYGPPIRITGHSQSLVGHPYENLGMPITLLWATQKPTWECPLDLDGPPIRIIGHSQSLVGHPKEHLGMPTTLLWATHKHSWGCPLHHYGPPIRIPGDVHYPAMGHQ